MIFEKTLAVVVSFNGLSKTRDVVNALIDDVEYVLVVDNASEPESLDVLSELENDSGCMIVRLNENMGIGYALNIGVEKARQLECNWLLTMDQDSVPDGNLLSSYHLAIAEDPKRVCLSPNVSLEGNDAVAFGDRQIEFAITSGNLVRLEVFEKVGLYNEELFIDSVDIDFSLRVRSAGYKIWLIKGAVLNHELGENVKKPRILSRFYTLHGPVRRYYMYRNHCFIIKNYLLKYPLFVVKATLYQIIYLLMILVMEPKPFVSIEYITKGVGDYFKGNLGRFQNTEHVRDSESTP